MERSVSTVVGFIAAWSVARRPAAACSVLGFSVGVSLGVSVGLCLAALAVATATPTAAAPVDMVDPFIGTGGHGHTFPGATLPFGMVQLSPDTRLEGWDGCSGYHYSDDRIFGFSHTHLSGTGIPDYGDILLYPYVGETKWTSGWYEPETGYGSHFEKSTESASPGYYAVTLGDTGVRVELTATARVGMHRYTFPVAGGAGSDGNNDTPSLLIDLAHRDQVLDAAFEQISDREVAGFRISKAWAQDQRVYFVARFSQPIREIAQPTDGTFPPLHIVRALHFESANEPLLVKVGISPVSIENARENLDAELPDWDFEAIREHAKQTWNDELSRIVIEGGRAEQRTIFYTALYHTLLQPNLFTDVNGEYRGHDGETHNAEMATALGRTGPLQYTVFSLWDTFRAAHPLYTILEPTRTVDFIHSMLRIYDQGGLLPVWELAGNETMCMIGYHSISAIADAHAKGIRGFDAGHALDAMVSSANRDHLGLAEYRRFGYIPGDRESESVSKTLEYAYDDWCIAEMATALGRADVADEFYRRARNWQNILDPETGFMRPKSDSRWKTPFLPTDVDFHFTEANSWQYSFFVPQDVNSLIDAQGGNDAFVAKLDALFTAPTETTGRDQADITGLIGQYAHGNEPSHHMAYLYAYAGAPWKTQSRVREILDTLYAAAPDGLAGNEDCGQMSAWYVLSALGFYAVTPGQDQYVIGTPLFDRATIHLENGNTFVVSRSGGANAPYVQSATLAASISGSGSPQASHAATRVTPTPLTRCFLSHDEITRGGELHFEMGASPNHGWGVGPGNAPVSRIEVTNPALPIPYVASGGISFRGSTEVTLAVPSLAMGSMEPQIRYTLDGTDPSASSPVYSTPLHITETTHLRFATFPDGLVQEATFRRITGNRQVVETTEPSPTYPGGSPEALIDGIRGGPDFRLGAWQGFEGKDLVATFDLGEVMPLHRLALGCLQDENSWIFMPSSVDFEVSVDGKAFTAAGSSSSGVDPKDQGGILREVAVLLDEVPARFVRVHAHSLQVCPDWHKGAGNPCWIFIDELLAE